MESVRTVAECGKENCWPSWQPDMETSYCNTGALLDHEVNQFSHGFRHHAGHHHVADSMAGLIGAAGAGMLGAKFFGGTSHSAQSTPTCPTPQAYPVPPFAMTTYPYEPMPPKNPSSRTGFRCLGILAVGGAAGVAGTLAVNKTSSLLHHHQHRGGAPTATG